MARERYATLDHVRPPWLGPRVHRIASRLALALVLVPALLGLAAVRRAASETPSDQAVAAEILGSLAKGPPDQQRLTHEPCEEAKRALERAKGARSAGDVRHADELDGLAREWAETARDLVRAASAEMDAGALESAAADAGVQAERGRALLEETLARRGEAAAELERLSAPDAGAKLPPKSPPVKPTKTPVKGAAADPKKAEKASAKPPAEAP